VLEDSGSSLVICESATEHVVEEAGRGDLAAVLVEGAPYDAVVADGRQRAGRTDIPSSRGDADLAVLLYTSGTSGRPKGAMLSHRTLLANLDQCARLEPAPVTPDDRVLTVLPLFHVYGLNGVLGMVVGQAATAVLARPLRRRRRRSGSSRRGVTNRAGAPPMWVAWAERADLGEALAAYG
jgi:long-chain acyl-CoA synthetase